MRKTIIQHNVVQCKMKPDSFKGILCLPVTPEQLAKAKPEFLKLDITDKWYID